MRKTILLKSLFCAICIALAFPAAAQEPQATQPVYDGATAPLSVQPTFKKKGVEKFAEWVSANVLYPKELIPRQIGGVVKIKVIVGVDGDLMVYDVEEETSPHRKLLADAVVRAAVDSPKWTPGKMIDESTGQEIPVRVAYVVPVTVKVPPKPIDSSITGVYKQNKQLRPYGSN